MSLRSALALALFAFALGVFVDRQYLGAPVAEPATAIAAVTTATAAAPTTSPAPASATGLAVAPVAASNDATPATADPPAPTLGDQIRNRPSGPDPTKMSQAEFTDAIATFFDQEKEDPAWKASTESFVSNHFYSENPFGVGATLTSVECRATICRITATSPGRSAQEVFGPRSSRWGELIALYQSGNTPAGNAPMQIVSYLRPMSTFSPPSR